MLERESRVPSNTVGPLIPEGGNTLGGRLTAQRINLEFGSFRILSDIGLEVERGECLGLIGPNGAGKTMLINVITGFQRASSGEVQIDGREVSTWSPERRVRAGIGRTFQGGRLFEGLTCQENVEVSALSVGFTRKQARGSATLLLRQFDLGSVKDLKAGHLPPGHARLLTMARALASNPSFLFLDEPAAGMDETESGDLRTTLSDLPSKRECGVVLVEHDMSVVLGISARIQVLDHGTTLALGSPEEVRNDIAVQQAYLGSAEMS